MFDTGNVRISRAFEFLRYRRILISSVLIYLSLCLFGSLIICEKRSRLHFEDTFFYSSRLENVSYNIFYLTSSFPLDST